MKILFKFSNYTYACVYLPINGAPPNYLILDTYAFWFWKIDGANEFIGIPKATVLNHPRCVPACAICLIAKSFIRLWTCECVLHSFSAAKWYDVGNQTNLDHPSCDRKMIVLEFCSSALINYLYKALVFDSVQKYYRPREICNTKWILRVKIGITVEKYAIQFKLFGFFYVFMSSNTADEFFWARFTILYLWKN